MRRSRASAPPRSRIISYAASSALVLAACADPLAVPPTSRLPVSPLAVALTNGPAFPLVSNRQRYRVAGSKPATGRSGSAEVTARAMAGKDGKTVLELSTGGLDAGFAPRGTLTRATDVVTVSERVKRRPDLTVTLGNQASALVRVPAEIAATVRELNGELGATTDMRRAR